MNLQKKVFDYIDKKVQQNQNHKPTLYSVANTLSGTIAGRFLGKYAGEYLGVPSIPLGSIVDHPLHISPTAVVGGLLGGNIANRVLNVMPRNKK